MEVIKLPMVFDKHEQDYTNTDESELIQLAQDGDKHAFGELYQRYITRIYNYVFYRVSNEQDAEDLTARVFIRALNHIGKYDDRGVPFSAWLYRIAHNLVANWHRDNSRKKVIPLDDYMVGRNPGDAPESLAESREEEELLLESVRELPEDRQQLLFLKFVERLPNSEIGEIMNRTEGAIKSLYHRTLLTLNEDLTARGILGESLRRHKDRKTQSR